MIRWLFWSKFDVRIMLLMWLSLTGNTKNMFWQLLANMYFKGNYGNKNHDVGIKVSKVINKYLQISSKKFRKCCWSFRCGTRFVHSVWSMNIITRCLNCINNITVKLWCDILFIIKLLKEHSHFITKTVH